MSYGGGGFLNSGGGGSGSQGSPGSKSANKALRPVTIFQIQQAQLPHPEADFIIDGQETKEVSFVACIRSVNRGSTNINFNVEDGTGAIDVRKWTESQSDDNANDGLEVNVYVRILGSIKSFNQKRQIVATQIRPLDDKNEIMFHAIECVYVHLYSTRGPPGGAVPAAVPAGANPYAAVGNGAADHGTESAYTDLRGLQRKIMEHIASLNASDALPGEGMNVNALARAVGNNLDKVRVEVEALVADGHLYLSIDDDHVLPTA